MQYVFGVDFTLNVIYLYKSDIQRFYLFALAYFFEYDCSAWVLLSCIYKKLEKHDRLFFFQVRKFRSEMFFFLLLLFFKRCFKILWSKLGQSFKKLTYISFLILHIQRRRCLKQLHEQSQRLHINVKHYSVEWWRFENQPTNNYEVPHLLICCVGAMKDNRNQVPWSPLVILEHHNDILGLMVTRDFQLNDHY